MWGNGSKINNKGKGLKHGPTEQSIVAIIKMEQNMVIKNFDSNNFRIWTISMG
jgi:hypothetical protein